ncbi:MAG: SMC family ATPase [Armatimonadetes bacterium]|nr:SMC family ATPase [Armatimonadota bacterium]
MVPLRVRVKGFLSYRDEAVIDFNGRNLWMLSGRNGVGKSTIFDAITFALFGDGRFGGRVVEGYWNKEARANKQDAVVEFDFDLAGTVYRAKRTFGSGSTYEIIDVAAGRTLAGKGQKLDIKEWIGQNFPLNKETFELVALLKQGKADAFLDADAKIRRDFVDKVVGMAPYNTLKGLVADRAKKLEGQKAQLQGDVTKAQVSLRQAATTLVTDLGLSPAEFPFAEGTWESYVPALLDRLTVVHQEAEGEITAHSKTLEKLTEYGVHLTTWKEAAQKLAQWTQQQGEFRTVLERAEELDKKQVRFELLREIFSPLKIWSEENERATQAKKREESASQELSQLFESRTALVATLEPTEKNLSDAEDAYTEAAKVPASLSGERKHLEDRKKLLEDNSNTATCAICDRPLSADLIATEKLKVAQQLKDLDARIAQAKDVSKNARQARDTARADLQAIRDNMSALDSQIQRIEQEQAIAQKEQKYTEGRIAEAKALLVAVEAYTLPTMPPTAAEVTGWKDEGNLLKTDKPAWEKLAIARKGAGNATGFEQQIKDAKTKLPVDWASGSLETAEELLKGERKTVGDARKHAENRRDRARDGQNQLRQTWDSYITMTQSLDEVSRSARAHRLLADRLGEKFLQKHLRAEAEKTIVHYANTIVQRLSQGTLYLDRNPDSDDALDLRVRDTEKTQEWLDVKAISGSQKFRLAVALALGVGQYAAKNAAGGVESVIIDEGFGSLDKENREQMIEELHRLGNILKRVIVVSHQEEFFAAFPDQWHVTFKDGSARANLYIPD